MSKLFIVSISFICMLIFGNFVLLPQYRNMKLLKAEVAEMQTELSFKEEYFADLRDLAGKLEQHSRELAKIDFALPDTPRLASFFEFLQKACSENGMILKGITSFTTSQSAQDIRIEESRIGFEVSGTFDSLMGFFEAFEKSARLVEVSHVSFTAPQESERSGQPEESAQDEIMLFRLVTRIRSFEK